MRGENSLCHSCRVDKPPPFFVCVHIILRERYLIFIARESETDIIALRLLSAKELFRAILIFGK